MLHYLPTYASEANPIERVWWHLREQIILVIAVRRWSNCLI
ncbi:MAG: transposase [Deltaproteobacteria bacterium]|nr:transposase [Deltaproteobacteria bacterium]